MTFVRTQFFISTTTYLPSALPKTLYVIGRMPCIVPLVLFRSSVLWRGLHVFQHILHGRFMGLRTGVYHILVLYQPPPNITGIRSAIPLRYGDITILPSGFMLPTAGITARVCRVGLRHGTQSWVFVPTVYVQIFPAIASISCPTGSV